MPNACGLDTHRLMRFAPGHSGTWWAWRWPLRHHRRNGHSIAVDAVAYPEIDGDTRHPDRRRERPRGSTWRPSILSACAPIGSARRSAMPTTPRLYGWLVS